MVQSASADELSAWGIAIAAGIGIIAAVVGEMHLRRQEWLIESLKRKVDALEEHVEQLKGDQRETQ